MTSWLDPVCRAIDDQHALKSPVWDRQKALVYKTSALRRAVAVEFGRLNGWALSQSVFGMQSIGRTQRRRDDHCADLESWEDHRLWYRADRPGRGLYAALVSQPYGPIERYREDLDKSANEHGLQWHLAPNPYASFHYPGQTLFIVMTMPGIEVKWLPEQAA
jgi:hypothetical protein